jgi:hypothetical protein
VKRARMLLWRGSWVAGDNLGDEKATQAGKPVLLGRLESDDSPCDIATTFGIADDERGRGHE